MSKMIEETCVIHRPLMFHIPIGGITMRRKILFVLVNAMPLYAVALASEVAIKMKDLPAAVRKTVEEQSKGATLHGLSKEVEAGLS
jgi:hypothetical protein